jgi:eukaryotic-like serine/threonine-protein kinase
MAPASAIEYRAFLSYSHRDKSWGLWLHRVLENYHIDKNLVGRETSVGPVPKTLRPIFLALSNLEWIRARHGG